MIQLKDISKKNYQVQRASTILHVQCLRATSHELSVILTIVDSYGFLIITTSIVTKTAYHAAEMWKKKKMKKKKKKNEQFLIASADQL